MEFYLNNRVYARVFLVTFALLGLFRYRFAEPRIEISYEDVFLRGVPVFQIIVSLTLMGLLGLIDTFLADIDVRRSKVSVSTYWIVISALAAVAWHANTTIGLFLLR